jgi:hypothetical protein
VHCCLAVDDGLFNLRQPATLLAPTDEAWAAALVSFGFNKTTLQDIDDFKLGDGALDKLPVILYHMFPNVTLTRASFTNGQSLSTNYEDKHPQPGLPLRDNIIVHTNRAIPGNITFHGLVNGTFPAGFNNTANLLFPDIPVLGSNGTVVMHVIDRVLAPSPEDFNRTVQALVALAGPASPGEEEGEEEAA